MREKLIAVLASFCVCFAGAASASTVVWDEAIDGDAGNGIGAETDLGTLGLGSGPYEITGTVGGVDAFDTYFFKAVTSFTVDLVDLVLTGTNTSTGFPLFDPGGSVLRVLGMSNPAQDIYGQVGPGTYIIDVREFSDDVSSYRLSINAGVTPVPLPAGGVLLLTGLGGLVALRRRQRLA